VRQVLESVVCTVGARTPFQRAAATCYDQPLIGGAEAPAAVIVEAASYGLSERQERELSACIAGGTSVTGRRYDARFAIGRSFFYPRGGELGELSRIIRSDRRYLTHDGWHQSDVLLVPFWRDGTILGHISADDPSDGRRPNESTLVFLEEIAAAAALSLRDAYSLERLTETHQLFRFLAESGVTGVIVVQDGNISYTNDRAAEILGFGHMELAELTPWWNFLHPDDRPFAWRCADDPHYASRTIRAIRKDGRTIWLSAYGLRMEYQQSDAVAYQFYDVTERVETEMQLKERALRDPLTGLRNRAYFDDTIHLEVARSQRYKRPFTLMIADLHGFKRINDTLGHREGDRILCAVARIFRNQLRDSDWIVRYGGDEFLFVLPETGSELATLVERMKARVAEWSEGNVSHDVSVSVDFGWSMWSPDAPQPVETLIEAADMHMYERKRRNAIELGRPLADSPSM
jgi:diguanylate cyclase (GGDEF)-like protein/PAS domain S-box-containing protein